MSRKPQRGTALRCLVDVPFVVIIFVLLVPIVPVVLLCLGVQSIVLSMATWWKWCRRGKHVLLVYSDSPKWKQYIEATLIPMLPENTIRLNWSERKSWNRKQLAVRVFYFFTRGREYNPVIIVASMWRRPRVFPMYRAFMDLKHGKPETLHDVEQAAFAYMKSRGIALPLADRVLP